MNNELKSLIAQFVILTCLLVSVYRHANTLEQLEEVKIELLVCKAQHE